MNKHNVSVLALYFFIFLFNLTSFAQIKKYVFIQDSTDITNTVFFDFSYAIHLEKSRQDDFFLMVLGLQIKILQTIDFAFFQNMIMK